MKEKRLILHIGTHKTGSTSIQKTLDLNRKLLASNGFFFPAVQPSNHSVSFYPIFMNDPTENLFIKGMYNISSRAQIEEKIITAKKRMATSF